MFPSKLELDVLYAERVRDAEHHRMARKFSAPSLIERIRARLSPVAASQPVQRKVVQIHQTTHCDVAVTSK